MSLTDDGCGHEPRIGVVGATGGESRVRRALRPDPSEPFRTDQSEALATHAYPIERPFEIFSNLELDGRKRSPLVRYAHVDRDELFDTAGRLEQLAMPRPEPEAPPVSSRWATLRPITVGVWR